MTMVFETVQASIVAILAAAEAGRYQTVGYQRQSVNADTVLDDLRQVQVFFSRGDFSKRAGRNTGSVGHDATYRIELTVSKAAVGELSVLDNPSATPAQLATALANYNEATYEADTSLNELAGIVYQVLMDGLNYDMGQSKGSVSSRWVPSISKDTPTTRGALVVLTGSLELNLRITEAITGDTGTESAEYYDTTIDIDGDDVESTGVIVDNT